MYILKSLFCEKDFFFEIILFLFIKKKSILSI